MVRGKPAMEPRMVADFLEVKAFIRIMVEHSMDEVLSVFR
jgi:hypothetical protein